MQVIEVTATAELPLGISSADFLANYWQKHPLLIRQAFADYQSPVSGDDLAGLACEETALSRLIIHKVGNDSWQVKTGPMDEKDFATLPKKHWTLLVQDCDKWFAEVEPILDRFDFLPSWRIDDIMISYAVDGGSVGAHVDQYDVFLLQAQGQRRWKISDDKNAPTDFRDDAELKLLKTFNPTHDWVLQAGDMLYLPPGFAHHGVAAGECLTFSIGMRAPSAAEMLVDFAEYIAEAMPEEQRYTDADLALQTDNSLIDGNALHRVSQVLAQIQTAQTTPQISEWFGRFISRYRSAQMAAPLEDTVNVQQLRKQLGSGSILLRNPWTRFVQGETESAQRRLFYAGEACTVSSTLAPLICQQRQLKADDCKNIGDSDWVALVEIVNQGHYVICND